MPTYVYILFSKLLQQYYTGCTNDVSKRLHDHNSGWSKHTAKGIPWTLIHSESFPTRTQALIKENSIKKRGAKRFLQQL